MVPSKKLTINNDITPLGPVLFNCAVLWVDGLVTGAGDGVATFGPAETSGTVLGGVLTFGGVAGFLAAGGLALIDGLVFWSDCPAGCLTTGFLVLLSALNETIIAATKPTTIARYIRYSSTLLNISWAFPYTSS